MRAELIAAADRILAQTGDVEALSLRGVAREVGVATPSIYLHFPDKLTLVRAVLAERFAQLGEAVRAAALAESAPAEQFRAGCLAYCRFATENPNAYRVLFGRAPIGETSPPNPISAPERGLGGEVSPAVSAGEVTSPGAASFSLPVGAEAFGFLIEGVSRCIEAGVAPPGDPLRAAIGVWTALHGIVSLRASVPGFPWPPLQQQVNDVLSRLVGLRHSPVTGDAGTPE